MLLARRLNGNLSREEFTAVAMMSWFHLTVDSDSAVVVDLRAQATSAEQRLFKIAQLVGVPAHGLSGSYFDIAESISAIAVDDRVRVLHRLPQRHRGAVYARLTGRTGHADDHHALVDHHRPRHEGRKNRAERRPQTSGPGGGARTRSRRLNQRRRSLYR